MKKNYCIVQTSCEDYQEAKNIGSAILQNKLGACVHISKINSMYEWDNEICEDTECLLSIKTKKEHFAKIKSKIKENHSYDLPEIIAIPIVHGSKKYLKWIDQNCE